MSQTLEELLKDMTNQEKKDLLDKIIPEIRKSIRQTYITERDNNLFYTGS